MRSSEQVHLKMFQLIDTNKTGYISVDEFIHALHSRGIIVDRANIQALFRLICNRPEPELNVEMFIHLMYVFEMADTTDPRAILFRAADINHTGKINPQEFYKILRKLNFEVDKHAVDILFGHIAQADGEIDYDVFSQIIDRLYLETQTRQTHQA
ncbi:Hypothetical protein GLP15_4413 [Giardia lamblia P15]|uniref:EF-hand domain-containing protein n=1 Tax=Giardia intestinalis (strain P15) TaxID=658858 RepID=E1F370_GIAIA|nr:Hypothetical protein GLP15_4413 [Giardia lamblia P15]